MGYTVNPEIVLQQLERGANSYLGVGTQIAPFPCATDSVPITPTLGMMTTRSHVLRGSKGDGDSERRCL